MLFCRPRFPPWHKSSKNLWDHGPREDEGFRRLCERRREPFRGREDRTSFPEHICVLHSSAGRIRARCPLPVSSRLLHPASPLRLALQRIARWPTPSRKLILSFRLRDWCAVFAARRPALPDGCARNGFRQRILGSRHRFLLWRRMGFGGSRFRPGTGRPCALRSGTDSAHERAA